MEKKDNIWIFTFEFAGVAKVGGLGEVPSNQARNLAEKFDITVFIPAHGQLDRLKKSYQIEELPFKCVGQIEPLKLGINKPECSYSIGFYKFEMDNVSIILLSGENAFTSEFLDDKTVYSPDTFSLKMCLFSMGIRDLIEYYMKERIERLPKIVHLHDYHVVIPFIGMKQILEKYDLDVRSIITIHLLTWPRFNLNFFKACGIDDTPIKILSKEGFKKMNIGEIFLSCEEKEEFSDNKKPPTVEKIGAFISDLVTTVSKSYLSEELIPNLGAKLIDYKSDFIWNGCDWSYETIFKEICNNLGEDMQEFLHVSNPSELTHDAMKKYLLTYKIGNLKKSPIIYSKKVLETIKQISQDNPFIKNGNVIPFEESGPLMITTGRISSQKGFETIFEAIPRVIKHVPDARFLFLLNPTDFSLKEMREYSEFIKTYPKNVRIIFGVTTEVYKFTHLIADVYAALSRWEPFGITALEAMSLKLPVIASRVGGLQESIIDIKTDPINGTGLLIDKDDSFEFAHSLISMLILSEVAKSNPDKKGENTQKINELSDEVIKFLAINDNHYYDKIRENCYNRVHNYFRWSKVTVKLAMMYDKLKNLNSM